MKYLYLFLLIVILLSCSELPTRDNPYDMEYFKTVAPELEIEVINGDTIRLKWIWEYEIDIIDGFRIEKKVYGEEWQLYEDDIDAELREWTDVNSSYLDSYRIKAFYQGYESDYSDEIIFEIEGMIFVEGGTYEMGDHFNEGESDELPVHTVTVSSFYIGQHEVTQGEYEAVMGSNPSYFTGSGENAPVEQVSWFDAVEYCNALSIHEGLTPCYDLDDDSN